MKNGIKNIVWRAAAVVGLIQAMIAPGATVTPTASYLHFEGALDRGRQPIVIDLLVEGTTVEGSYYRSDRGAWTIVQGTLARGRMTLIERNGEGQEVAPYAAGDFDIIQTWNELLSLMRTGTAADRLAAAPAQTAER